METSDLSYNIRSLNHYINQLIVANDHFTKLTVSTRADSLSFYTGLTYNELSYTINGIKFQNWNASRERDPQSRMVALLSDDLDERYRVARLEIEIPDYMDPPYEIIVGPQEFYNRGSRMFMGVSVNEKSTLARKTHRF